MRTFHVICAALAAAGVLGVHEAYAQGMMGSSPATRVEDAARINGIVAGDIPTKTELRDKAIAKIKGLKGANFVDLAEASANDRKAFGNQSAGVGVKDVAKDSKAAQAGLRAGDVVTAVDDHAVGTLDQFCAQLEPPRHNIALAVKRGTEDARVVIP
jgi:C-terminal processing protease CtpA/Prc